MLLVLRIRLLWQERALATPNFTVIKCSNSVFVVMKVYPVTNLEAGILVFFGKKVNLDFTFVDVHA